MDTREVALVDAFAAEPTGGTPVGVVPDGDLAPDQRRAVATELAAPTAFLGGSPDLRVVTPGGDAPDSPGGTTAATVAALAYRHERDGVAAGTHDVATAAGVRSVTVEEDGRVWVDRPEPNPRAADVAHDAVADALGVDVAALRDVGADLPPTRIEGEADALVVPVNFLEHLSDASPDPAALGDLAARADVSAVCAFTFDTLEPDAACHARTFVPGDAWSTRQVGCEVLATPGVVAGCVAHLVRRGTVEADEPTVEQGHFRDRPGRIDVRVDEDVRVGGRAVTTLQGTVAVPPAEDDDIIEV